MICAHCNKPYPWSQRNVKLCSDECRRQRKNERQREWARRNPGYLEAWRQRRARES